MANWDLFNWWPIEVVPASWHLRKPDFLYTIGTPWPPTTTSRPTPDHQLRG